jgi:YggT family protein
MTGGYLSSAGVFLVDFVIGLYMLVVLLRLWFQFVRADFHNPVSQTIVMLTNPPLLWLRKLIPGLWGIDWAAVVLLCALGLAKQYLVHAMFGVAPKLVGALLLTAADILELIGYTLMVAIFVRIILSWISPHTYNPIVHLLHRITEPFLAPARRLLPAMGGLDLSPILVLLGLGIGLRLVVQPLFDYGRAFSG